jgi:hypothetical protein
VGFILGKTPPKFSQNRVYIMTKGFGKVEEGHCIAGDGIGNSLDKGSTGCLREEFSLPTRNSVKDLKFKIIKSQIIVSEKEKGEAKVFCIGRDEFQLKNRMDGI